MDNSMNKSKNPRREFLGSIATGAAALGIGSFLSPLDLQASIPSVPNNYLDADAWFNTIKGKHRIVFDCTEPHEIFPFAWPRVYLMTNAATGTPEKDCSVVVVLRGPHDKKIRILERCGRNWNSACANASGLLRRSDDNQMTCFAGVRIGLGIVPPAPPGRECFACCWRACWLWRCRRCSHDQPRRRPIGPA